MSQQESEASNQDGSTTVRRIAVIAIHGVGDHPPFQMANSVADILEDLDASGQPMYTPFKESRLRLNVAPVNPPSRYFKPALDPNISGKWLDEKHTWGPLDSVYKRSAVAPRDADECDPSSLDHIFMEGQLAGYVGERPEDTYEFQRLEGHRLKSVDGDRVLDKEIHIYDMYWSDLSKLGNVFTQVFGELYQLLFHLGSIGVNNVKAAATSLGRPKPWKIFTACETGAASMLAWPIVFFNLFMLMFVPGMLGAALLRKLDPNEEFVTTAIAVLAVAVAAIGFGLTRLSRINRFWFVLPLILLGAALYPVLTWAYQRPQDFLGWRETIELIASLLLYTATFGCILLITTAYNKRRPGSWVALGTTLLLFVVAAVVVLLSGRLPAFGSIQYYAIILSVKLIEIALWLLIIAGWLPFSILTLAALVSGTVAVRWTKTNRDAEAYVRARRTHRTAWLVLGASASIFLIVSLAGWTALVNVMMPLLPHNDMMKTRDCLDGSKMQRACPTGEGAGLKDVCYAPIIVIGSHGFGGQQITAPPSPISCWAMTARDRGGMAFFPFFLVLLGHKIASC